VSEAPKGDLTERPSGDAAELLAIHELVADLGRPEIMDGAWR
jgi:hypothetical protein